MHINLNLKLVWTKKNLTFETKKRIKLILKYGGNSWATEWLGKISYETILNEPFKQLA